MMLVLCGVFMAERSVLSELCNTLIISIVAPCILSSLIITHQRMHCYILCYSKIFTLKHSKAECTVVYYVIPKFLH
jgi:hypothetical protein